MNKKFFGLFLLTAISAVTGLCAKDESIIKQAQPTIVVVDLGQISIKTEKFAAMRDKLEKEIQAKAEAIQNLEKDMETKIANLRAKVKDMTVAAREKEEEGLGRMQAELEVKKRNLQAYVQRVAGEVEGELVTEVRKICKEKGWTVVVPNALYADASVDKTSDVIQAMNATYKAAPKKA